MRYGVTSSRTRSRRSSARSVSYRACIFNQNPTDVAKNVARRAAVSAVMDRRPCTISCTRRLSTPSPRASALCEIPNGSINSSFKRVPGCVGGIFLWSAISIACTCVTFKDESVIVYNFDSVRITAIPDKANTPLVVDTNGVLPLTFASQLLKTIARGNAEVVQGFCGVDQNQLLSSSLLNIFRYFLRVRSLPDPLRRF